MTTFVFVHGAGETGWCWHLVAEELRQHGHRTIAPDLPCDDDTAGLGEYADTVVTAARTAAGRPETAGGTRDADDVTIVVGHSFGGFTAPQVAARLGADQLVLLAAMIPAPGEPPAHWWENTGYERAVREQAASDGGLTGHEDPFLSFYHDVPRQLAAEALRRTRTQSGAPVGRPWPLPRWPDVPTRCVVCVQDRVFPLAFAHAVAWERLGLLAEEFESGHMPMLSRPRALAALLMEGRRG